jgi:hypothetical protein
MLLVIGAGRVDDPTNSAELASSETLEVGGAADAESDDHSSHAESDDHSSHADGDDDSHADGDDHGSHANGDGDSHVDDAAHAEGDDHATHTEGAAHVEGAAHAEGDPHAEHPASGPTHPHDPTEPTDPTDPTHPTHPQPPPSIYTQTQLDLLAATQAAISPRYDDVNAAIAAGYRSINDAGTGWEHYVNSDYLATPEVLNPATIESLVYKVEGAKRTLVSGMYILPIGQTFANVPSAFDTPQTPWHVHSNLCWAGSPIQVVGTTSTGQAGCPRGSVYFVTPPMLHVWLEEQTCGWFADLEQVGGGDCDLHPH